MTNVVQKMNYSHTALIDQVIANPWMTQRDLAALFGYTESWISLVMSSDVFKEALAARRDEVVTPTVIASVEQRLEGLARQSLDRLREALDRSFDPELALQTAALTVKALGFGARDRGSVGVQNNYVVVVPQKEANSKSWREAYGPQPAPIDVSPQNG
jgi:hypothetical protein